MNAQITFDPSKMLNTEKTISAIIKFCKLWTPRDTGALLGSLYRKGNVIGYGADYAVYVHERIDALHKTPTRAKFLEDAAVIAATECNYRGRIGITYEPLAVYVGDKRGTAIYEGGG